MRKKLTYIPIVIETLEYSTELGNGATVFHDTEIEVEADVLATDNELYEYQDDQGEFETGEWNSW